MTRRARLSRATWLSLLVAVLVLVQQPVAQ